MKILIDADWLMYRACKAVEREEIFSEDHHVLYSSFEEALDKFERLLEDTLAEYADKTDDWSYELHVSSSENWRKKIYPSYKANRSQRKPLCYARLRHHVCMGDESVVVPGLEADDSMGLAQTESDEDTLIISPDKDFLGVPGKFFRVKSDSFVIEHMQTADMARLFHMKQTLMGDRVDGYFGVPGVGKVKAERILRDFEDGIPEDKVHEAWHLVVDAFEQSGGTERDAEINATVAHIKHHSSAPRPWLLTSA